MCCACSRAQSRTWIKFISVRLYRKKFVSVRLKNKKFFFVGLLYIFEHISQLKYRIFLHSLNSDHFAWMTSVLVVWRHSSIMLNNWSWKCVTFMYFLSILNQTFKLFSHTLCSMIEWRHMNSIDIYAYIYIYIYIYIKDNAGT